MRDDRAVGQGFPHGYQPARPPPSGAASLPKTLGLATDTVIVLDALRKQRNLNDYEGDPVADAAVAECLAQAEALISHTRQWLIRSRPDLLAREQ